MCVNLQALLSPHQSPHFLPAQLPRRPSEFPQAADSRAQLVPLSLCCCERRLRICELLLDALQRLLVAFFLVRGLLAGLLDRPVLFELVRVGQGQLCSEGGSQSGLGVFTAGGLLCTCGPQALQLFTGGTLYGPCSLELLCQVHICLDGRGQLHLHGGLHMLPQYSLFRAFLLQILQLRVHLCTGLLDHQILRLLTEGGLLLAFFLQAVELPLRLSLGGPFLLELLCQVRCGCGDGPQSFFGFFSLFFFFFQRYLALLHFFI
mmetsp:Transcript_45521/g.88919  ORF Transcript_45521/g.88919 Transcript_45521/m.88919 type:complete len:262 (-) Transcript_45521:1240-2025(-)